jgi:hypothetical protein
VILILKEKKNGDYRDLKGSCPGWWCNSARWSSRIIGRVWSLNQQPEPRIQR